MKKKCWFYHSWTIVERGVDGYPVEMKCEDCGQERKGYIECLKVTGIETWMGQKNK